MKDLSWGSSLQLIPQRGPLMSADLYPHGMRVLRQFFVFFSFFFFARKFSSYEFLRFRLVSPGHMIRRSLSCKRPEVACNRRLRSNRCVATGGCCKSVAFAPREARSKALAFGEERVMYIIVYYYSTPPLVTNTLVSGG